MGTQSLVCILSYRPVQCRVQEKMILCVCICISINFLDNLASSFFASYSLSVIFIGGCDRVPFFFSLIGSSVMLDVIACMRTPLIIPHLIFQVHSSCCDRSLDVQMNIQVIGGCLLACSSFHTVLHNLCR